MAKKKADKLSWSDRNASRQGQPGAQPQRPAATFIIKSADGKRVLGQSRMNYGGVAGGLPTSEAGELRDRARAAGRAGNTDTARAAEKRAKNVEGHEKMTSLAKKEIEARRKAARRKKLYPSSPN